MLARKRDVFRRYSVEQYRKQPWYYTRQGRLEAALYIVVLVAMAVAIYWLA
jgi:hypothetical protein